MAKFLDKNLTIILLSIIGYFLFSISNSLKDSANYNSDLRACARMKAFFNDKNLYKLYKEQASLTSGVEVQYISEYCKKLTQQNIF